MTNGQAAQPSTQGQDFILSAIRKAKEEVPKSDKALWYWLEYVMGFSVAWKAVCPEHTAPFQFIADSFFHRFGAAAVLGARGAGKTRGLSLFEFLACMFFPDYEITHVASVQRQAQQCYTYLQGYLKDQSFKAQTTSSLATETKWRNGSKLAILPGTLAATSGPHPNTAVADEFDLMDWQVYQQFVGMPLGHGNYHSQTIFTSAMVTSFGPMARLMAEGEQRGMKIYRSCLFESMAPCMTCPDFDRLKQGLQVKEPDCPLWEHCQGRCYVNSPTGGSTGHISKRDAINKLMQSDLDTFMVQQMCQRTSTKGLVFERFDPTPNEEPGITNVSPNAEYDPNLPVVWFLDQGWSPDPSVILSANIHPNGDVWVFDEIFATTTLPETIREWVWSEKFNPLTGRNDAVWVWQEVAWDEEHGPRLTDNKRMYKKPAALYGATPDRMLAETLGKLGIPIRTPTKINIMEGLGEMRRLIHDAQGHRSLVFHPRCMNSIREFSLYHRRKLPSGEYDEKPADNIGNSNADNAPDAVRTFMSFNLEGRTGRIEAARHG